MANNKRIAKNTVVLYIRMLITMGIGFYSSRVVLEQLGVDAYGVYNLVGGIVVLMSFINSAMTNATQRFINYEKGRGDNEQLRLVLSASRSIHIWIALIIGVIAEAIGPWILNEYLNIPADLLAQANWVYQFSVLSFMIGIIVVPYTALVVAHERMTIFAVSSITEAVLKLLSAVALFFLPHDRLAFYGLFILISTLISKGLFYTYCMTHFDESRRLPWKINKDMAKKLVSFSGWSIVGNIGYILHTQGIAIVINLFFTAAVNATQGIANQVNGMIQALISNFVIALNPQIVQSYAAKEYDEMYKLIFQGCRLAIFLTALFVVPIIEECRGLLGIWLTVIPPYTTGFVKTILLISLVNSITAILSTSQNATGNIKKYQIILTCIGLTHVPLAILAFWLGGSPLWSVYIYLAITIVLQAYRIYHVSRSTGMNIRLFLNRVIFKSSIAILVGAIPPTICGMTFPDKTVYVLMNAAISFTSVAIAFMYIGLSHYERKFIFQFIKSKIH